MPSDAAAAGEYNPPAVDDVARTSQPMMVPFLRYAGAGAIGTAAQFAILIALVRLAGAHAVTASTVGAVAGAMINYAVNYRYTFESRAPHARAVPRFAAIALAGIGLNAVVIAAALGILDANLILAQVVATGAVLGFTYVANRAWTF